MIVSPFWTWSRPSGSGVALLTSRIEPRKTPVDGPVSVSSSVSGIVSVVLDIDAVAVSGAPGSRFRSASLTSTRTVAFDW